MSFKRSTNFLLLYVRKPAKYGGSGSIGLDATPTVLIHICHPVHGLTNGYIVFVEFPKFSSFSNCTLQEGKSQILDEPPKLMSF